jgi:uncharacterized protein YjbJ (UPF0337 family)
MKSHRIIAAFRHRWIGLKPYGDTNGEILVDKNRIEGTAENVVGKVEDAVGSLTGDTGAQVEGKARQAAGATQATYGKAVDQVKPLIERLERTARDRPLTSIILAFASGLVVARIRNRNLK